jgi:leucine-rich repeat protein SHOC2
MTKLTLFHASSNQLTTLPESFSECSSLECVFVNSNHLTSIPLDIPRKLLSLKRINFSNNSIAYLPSPFLDRFGSPDATTGLCDKVHTVIL